MYWLYTWQIIRFDDQHFLWVHPLLHSTTACGTKVSPTRASDMNLFWNQMHCLMAAHFRLWNMKWSEKTKPSFILWTEDATVFDASTTKGLIISFPVVPGQHISQIVPQDQTGVWFSNGCPMSDEVIGKDVQCGLYQAHMELNKQEIS